ncbi:hypothetical protein TNIN_148801 [Trichonephila inaurata madagascariensis]|uniref:Uncharacterized protein n=1 Tax=Trichonephila inaurata madagascariensis TaxID=2747483 RepID=A0A8X6MIG1_9ARAC|nr:hypothetical protein TNIN_148801 [Trichonephila inaurata madagascariensis]
MPLLNDRAPGTPNGENPPDYCCCHCPAVIWENRFASGQRKKTINGRKAIRKPLGWSGGPKIPNGGGEIGASGTPKMTKFTICMPLNF